MEALVLFHASLIAIFNGFACTNGVHYVFIIAILTGTKNQLLVSVVFEGEFLVFVISEFNNKFATIIVYKLSYTEGLVHKWLQT